jgi:deoxycytidylate deaminase
MESSVYTSRSPIDVSCMALAVLWAELRSKDPRTRVGACVYHPKSGGLFLGYNGFPAGVPDLKSVWEQRDRTQQQTSKYHFVVHAEINAIRKALTVFRDLSECLLYVTHYPCHACMKEVISAGLKTVVYMSHLPADPATAELADLAKVTLKKSRSEFVFQDETQKPWDSGAPMSITIRTT